MNSQSHKSNKSGFHLSLEGEQKYPPSKYKVPVLTEDVLEKAMSDLIKGEEITKQMFGEAK